MAAAIVNSAVRHRVRVALVMPVLNEEDEVDSTMAAVFASTRLPDEIIIADAMSTDGTVARLQPWTKRGVPVRIVSNPTIYCGGGRNVGARNTDCDVIVIADFGNPMNAEYLEQMIRPFEEQEGVDITMGILVPLMRTSFEECMGKLYFDENLRLKDLTLEQKQAMLPEVLLPGGGCIGMRRDFLLQMDGYPEWLARSQDRLFSLKAWCRNAKVVVAWDAYSYNHVRSTPRAVFRMAFGWARCNGQSRYIRKHLLKVLPFYGLVLALALAGIAVPLAGAGALALVAGYFYKAGYRRLRQVDGAIRRASYLWQAPAILVAGDLGTIVGHAVGWYEWFTRPDYRAAFRRYMDGCPPDRLHIVER